MRNYCKASIDLFIKSIENGYLSGDVFEYSANDLVLTESEFLALKSDCIETDCGSYLHEEKDRELYGCDDIDECFRLRDDLVEAKGRRGAWIFTHPDNTIYYAGTYYLTEELSYYDLVEMPNGNIEEICNVYYWESDGEYHYEPEEEEEEETEPDENTLYSYGGGPTEKSYVSDEAPGDFSTFGWGIEIEKSELPGFDWNRATLYEQTGAVIERDGSVSDGFELKTPIYNLFSPKTLERLAPLEAFCNVKGVRGAGGHIGFSMAGKSDEELLNLCRSFIPLIYAMHKKRMYNEFCPAKKLDAIKSDGAKYQSIRMRGNYLEFRIFGAVRSYSSLIFRLNFFKFMARNLGSNFAKVLLMATSKRSELYQLLRSVYVNEADFTRLIEDTIKIDTTFGEGKLTAKALDKIQNRLRKLFNGSGGNSGSELPPPPPETNQVI
jgi:hypothetical protein